LPDDALTRQKQRDDAADAGGNANKEIAAQTIDREKLRAKSETSSQTGANDRTHAAMIGFEGGFIRVLVHSKRRF